MGWQEDLADLVGEVTGTGTDWTAQLGGAATTLDRALQPPPYLSVPLVRVAKTIQQRRPLQDALGADLGGSDELPKVSLTDITDLLGRVVKR